MEAERVHFTKEDIGAEILPILTSGLYRDTLDTLREYIQNAIDAHSNQIILSIDPDLVSVNDDGAGMTRVEARQAMRFGISEKNPKQNIGFRGIGIYSAFNLCDTLEIFTKSQQDNLTYKLYFDFKRIRRDLLEEQMSRTRGQPPKLYLERLLGEAVFMQTVSNGLIKDHGTKVIMSGLRPESYLRLNNWEQVVEYLQNVVPLPFSREFRFGSFIEKKFTQEDYRVVPLTLQMGMREEQLYRPYTNAIFKFGGRHRPKFFQVAEGGEHFGFAWVCVNDARETIKDARLRGLLIKKFDFSIADRRYLEPYFGRTVYNRRITGEIIVTHLDLIPNAARSDFENNSTRQSFLEALPRLTREIDAWANKIQEDDRAREVLAELTKQLSDINNELPSIQRDRERLLKLNAELAEVERRLKPQVRRLKDIDENGLAKARELLNGIQNFVKEGLLGQRMATQKLEQEIVKAIQRKAVSPTESDQDLIKSLPKDLIALFDIYSLLDQQELRRAFQYLDDNILKVYLDKVTYPMAIRELRDYLEENL